MPGTSSSNDPPGGSSHILTVSQLTSKIKTLLEERFPLVWVEGEMSNLRHPPSGHLYLTLKDEFAQIGAVIFRGQRRHLKFEPEDGLSVIGLGRISVYEPRGSYQIVLEHIEPAGRGALQVAFEQLKARLSALGYFDQERKRRIPFLPLHLSLITSPGGAVVHDMLKVVNRRFPNVAVDIVGVSVQGAQAAAEIVAAIELVNLLKRSQVAVLARGGGSLEDLQAFNSESVAMAIAASEIPVVSAVGHETDYTISDFVSDLRAPTPSAAIEMILPDKQALRQRLSALSSRVYANFKYFYNTLKDKHTSLAERLTHPRKKLQDMWLRLDDDTSRLERSMRGICRMWYQQLSWLNRRLQPTTLERQLKNNKLKHEELNYYISKSLNIYISNLKRELGVATARMSALNPLAVLRRGYSITRTLPGHRVVVDSDQVHTGQGVEVILSQGQLRCRVEEKTGNGQENL